jgi:membrane protease YdiL (CAAX protease family)
MVAQSLMTAKRIHRLLERAGNSLNAGHRERARQLLGRALEADPYSERGWVWLAEAVSTKAERRYCLAQALSINQRNALARRELAALGAGSARSPLEAAELASSVSSARRRGVDVGRLIRAHPLLFVVGYLMAITITEFLTLIVDPRIGLWGHSILLAMLVVHAALIWRRPFYRLILTLTFAPLIRLVSLTMPLARFPQIYWYLISSIPLFVTALLVAYTLGYSRRQIGLIVGNLPLQLLIGLSGVVLGVVEFVLLRPEPLADSLTWGGLTLPALILLICTGLSEELIFRGIMQRAAMDTLGRIGGFYVAAIFAMMHMGHASWLDIFFVFGVSLYFSWIVEKTKSILGVTIAHGLTNILLFLVLPALG